MSHARSRVRYSIILAASLAAVAAPAIASATPQIGVVTPRKGGSPAVSSDAEIVGIVATANRVLIAEASLVLPRLETTEVRAFAEREVSDHAALQVALSDLVGMLVLTPEESAASRMIEQQAADEISQLVELEGAALEDAYVDDQISAHQRLIEMVQTKLIPAAQSPELRSFLEALSVVVTEHLEEARDLDAMLAEHYGQTGGQQDGGQQDGGQQDDP